MAGRLRYIAAALFALGLVLPSFIIASVGLIALSIYMPLAGLLAGFLMDIVFGPPAWLPHPIAYPFTILAAALSLGAIVLAKYIR
jgi:hypothetical protein